MVQEQRSSNRLQPLPEPFLQGLWRLYEAIDAELAQAGVRCELSGRCCRFSEYGHQLFVSMVEAWWLAQQPPPPGPITAERCPYQVGRRCTAHGRRPLGCRVFFCDPAYQARMQELAERYTKQLKELHIAHEVPWRYGPLHVMLEAVLKGTTSAGLAGGL